MSVQFPSKEPRLAVLAVAVRKPEPGLLKTQVAQKEVKQVKPSAGSTTAKAVLATGVVFAVAALAARQYLASVVVPTVVELSKWGQMVELAGAATSHATNYASAGKNALLNNKLLSGSAVTAVLALFGRKSIAKAGNTFIDAARKYPIVQTLLSKLGMPPAAAPSV
jgi:hypothetical protein